MSVSAYILPYYVNDQQQIKVLCAQKQVISYMAIGHTKGHMLRNATDWQSLGEKIAQTDNILLENGKSVGNIGIRFNGIILPRGGKTCFLGGIRQNDVSPRHNAIRQFHEEVDIGGQHIFVQTSSLKEIHSEQSGAYIYYAAELNQLRKLDLDKINQTTAAFERGQSSNLYDIFNRRMKEQRSGNRFPEMHALKWVDLCNLDQEMNDPGRDEAFIRDQCQQFCTFLTDTLRVQHPHPGFTEHIIERLMDWPVDYNVAAARKLMAM